MTQVAVRKLALDKTGRGGAYFRAPVSAPSKWLWNSQKVYIAIFFFLYMIHVCIQSRICKGRSSVCMWRWESGVSSSTNILYHNLFRQGLSLYSRLTGTVGWLATKSQRFYCLYFPSRCDGTTGVH